MKKRAIASWSGGKDSCFALYKVLQSGLDVAYMVNFISKQYKRSSFHGIQQELIMAQAESLNIALLQPEVVPDMSRYEEIFKEAVSKIKREQAIEAMVFGDIELAEHRQWVERVCSELEIEAIEPLWHLGQENIMKDFINKGFEAVVVSTQADILGEEWVGRKIDEKFLEDAIKKGIHPCGELGEYHTFVYNGPIFKKPVQFSEHGKVKRDGYWFLDIRTEA